MTITVGRASAMLTAVLLAAIAGSAGGAEDLRLEGEEFRLYGHHNIGGLEITAEYCSAASERLAADGLDVEGEWIKLKVTFPDPDCYESVIAYQAGYDEPVWLRVRLLEAEGPGQDLESDHLLINGYGFG